MYNQRVYDSGIETYLAAFYQSKVSKEGALKEDKGRPCFRLRLIILISRF